MKRFIMSGALLVSTVAFATDFEDHVNISSNLTVGGTISGNGGGITNLNGAAIASGTVGSAALASNAVQQHHIASGAVGAQQLASNAVQGTAISSGAVGTTQLASGAVTSNKLAGGSIGLSQMHLPSVDSRYLVKSGDTWTGAEDGGNGVSTNWLLVEGKSLRGPYGGGLSVTKSGTPDEDWTHLTILDADQSGNELKLSYGSTEFWRTFNLGGVVAWSQSVLNLGIEAYPSYYDSDNLASLYMANLAGGSRIDAGFTWNHGVFANLYNSPMTLLNFGASIAAVSGDSAGGFHAEELQGSVLAARLESGSTLTAHGCAWNPVFCLVRLQNGADATIIPGGTAAAVLYSPSGEANLITGGGTLSVGNSITNTHSYAMAFGDGVTTIEDNAVHARKFFANGHEVATLTYIPKQGDISMGSFTNSP